MKITTTVTYPDECIADLLCIALEGGSNYWCSYEGHDLGKGDFFSKTYENYPQYCAPLCTNGALYLSDEEDGGRRLKLTRRSLETGLKNFIEKEPRHFANWINERADAETGDVFLQCCLFDEVKYG